MLLVTDVTRWLGSRAESCRWSAIPVRGLERTAPASWAARSVLEGNPEVFQVEERAGLRGLHLSGARSRLGQQVADAVLRVDARGGVPESDRHRDEGDDVGSGPAGELPPEPLPAGGMSTAPVEPLASWPSRASARRAMMRARARRPSMRSRSCSSLSACCVFTLSILLLGAAPSPYLQPASTGRAFSRTPASSNNGGATIQRNELHR